MVCGDQPAVWIARSTGIVQRAALSACKIFKYLHAIEQHFACCQKWRRAARSVAYTFWHVYYAQKF